MNNMNNLKIMEVDEYRHLLHDYRRNYYLWNALAINTAVSVEIPVYNTLAVLPKFNFTQFLNIILEHLQDSPLTDTSLALTLVTDFLTCAMKYNHFFTSYTNNNIQLVQMLCKKITSLVRKVQTKEECDVLLADLTLMKKYAERINYLPFKNLLVSSEEKLKKLIQKENFPLFTNFTFPNGAINFVNKIKTDGNRLKSAEKSKKPTKKRVLLQIPSLKKLNIGKKRSKSEPSMISDNSAQHAKKKARFSIQ